MFITLNASNDYLYPFIHMTFIPHLSQVNPPSFVLYHRPEAMVSQRHPKCPSNAQTPLCPSLSLHVG